MPNFDVLVIGELNVDIILSGLPGLPGPGQEKIARKMVYTLGSSSAIFSHNLARLGAKVAFAGKVGDDSHGRYVVEALRSAGVDTSGIVVDPGTATGLTVSLSLPSDRALVTYPGAMERFASGDINPSLLERARHLHVSSYYLQPALRPDLPALLRSAKGLGLTTSLDPGHDPADRWDGIWDLLPQVDVFLPNEEEALRITGCDGLETAGARLAQRAGMVVIKRGMDGAVAWARAATRTRDGTRAGAGAGTETVAETATRLGIGAAGETGALTGPGTAAATGAMDGQGPDGGAGLAVGPEARSWSPKGTRLMPSTQLAPATHSTQASYACGSSGARSANASSSPRPAAPSPAPTSAAHPVSPMKTGSGGSWTCTARSVGSRPRDPVDCYGFVTDVKVVESERSMISR